MLFIHHIFDKVIDITATLLVASGLVFTPATHVSPMPPPFYPMASSSEVSATTSSPVPASQGQGITASTSALSVDAKPQSAPRAMDGWRVYYNPSLNFGFKYPQTWQLDRTQPGDGFWDISVSTKDPRTLQRIGTLDMQIQTIVAGEPAVNVFDKPYGKIMGANATTNGGAIAWASHGYSFIIGEVQGPPQTIRKILDTFSFVPPPEEMTVAQRAEWGISTWQTFKSSKNGFAFTYPPELSLKYFDETHEGSAVFLSSADWPKYLDSHNSNVYVYSVLASSTNSKLPTSLPPPLMINLTGYSSVAYGVVGGVPARVISAQGASGPATVVFFTLGNFTYFFAGANIESAIFDEIVSSFTAG